MGLCLPSRGPGGVAPEPSAGLRDLASDRGASRPGSRRGLARKRRERAEHTAAIRHADCGVHFPDDDQGAVMAVMVGVDPHKGSHTAFAVDATERSVSELRVRSGPKQVERLLAWAEAFPDRAWAIENATGLGYLVAQQLVAAGERVLDVQPKLAARVRLLDTESVNKNDPHDARSVAIAARRAPSQKQVGAEGHAA